MGKHRTLEEKQLLISKYKESGLSLNQWCTSNNVAPSTITDWMYPERRKAKSKHKKNVDFIEVPTEVSSITGKSDSLRITCNSIEIKVTTETDFTLLKNVLEVVKSIDV